MANAEEHAPATEPVTLPDVPELPARVLHTYAQLWQLETWLRRMVYVELRALKGDDWAAVVRRADHPKEADGRLTHMPTPEASLLSYALFSEMCRIVVDHWNLFEAFLPPQEIWKAKLEEVSQIRNRVAHFRVGHSDDLHRVLQLLRDLDQGIWRFCTSYNTSEPVLPQTDDPVVSYFLHLDPFPWGKVGENKWARCGSADPAAKIGVTVEVICRPWADAATPAPDGQGLLYDVRITARKGREFDYGALLKDTKDCHQHLVYIHLDSGADSVRVTVPAVLGSKAVISNVEQIVNVAQSAATHGDSRHSKDGAVQRVVDGWPEYLVGPENPLTFLDPDMPCSFFGA